MVQRSHGSPSEPGHSLPGIPIPRKFPTFGFCGLDQKAFAFLTDDQPVTVLTPHWIHHTPGISCLDYLFVCVPVCGCRVSSAVSSLIFEMESH